MMAGEVTEFAKKKFKEGDKNVAQYLAQVKAQVAEDIKAKETKKEEPKKPEAHNFVKEVSHFYFNNYRI
jgi:ABC-type proline/glycine betaine transport system substrate-binding protein